MPKLRLILLLVSRPFWWTDDDHAAAIDATQAADDGGVVGEGAIAGQFLELIADDADVVERVRTRRWRASCETCQG
jgi:hypothetical protein